MLLDCRNIVSCEFLAPHQVCRWTVTVLINPFLGGPPKYHPKHLRKPSCTSTTPEPIYDNPSTIHRQASGNSQPHSSPRNLGVHPRFSKRWMKLWKSLGDKDLMQKEHQLIVENSESNWPKWWKNVICSKGNFSKSQMNLSLTSSANIKKLLISDTKCFTEKSSVARPDICKTMGPFSFALELGPDSNQTLGQSGCDPELEPGIRELFWTLPWNSHGLLLLATYSSKRDLNQLGLLCDNSVMVKDHSHNDFNRQVKKRLFQGEYKTDIRETKRSRWFSHGWEFPTEDQQNLQHRTCRPRHRFSYHLKLECRYGFGTWPIIKFVQSRRSCCKIMPAREGLTTTNSLMLQLSSTNKFRFSFRFKLGEFRRDSLNKGNPHIRDQLGSRIPFRWYDVCTTTC